MTDKERDRIECAIRHIQTAVDVDPWAVEIAVEAMQEKISRGQNEDVMCSEIPNSSDCISRETLLAHFEPWLKVAGYSEGEMNMLRAVLYEVKIFPPAQPELIRCKDCKCNYSTAHNPMCDFMDAQLYPDSFCSYAERRADERFNQQAGGD